MQIYKRNGKTFRYNFETQIVQYVVEPTDDGLKDNEDGYCVLDSAGLKKSNWINKEARDTYLDNWSEEIDEEVAYLVREFMEYG